MTQVKMMVALLILTIVSGCAASSLKFSSLIITWHHGDTEGDAFICIPKGNPPFPAVVHNHGAVVDQQGLMGAAQKGYNLEALCEGYAKDGYLGFLPVRRSSENDLRAHLREVIAALAAVKARPDVDPNRVTLAGHSRGGLLTLMAAIRGTPARSYMLFAPATGPRKFFTKLLGAVRRIDSPVLMMVERNDKFAEVWDAVNRLDEAFRTAGIPYRFIRYDRGGGHNLFFAPDYYWPDMLSFLGNPPESDRHGFGPRRWGGGGFPPGRWGGRFPSGRWGGGEFPPGR